MRSTRLASPRNLLQKVSAISAFGLQLLLLTKSLASQNAQNFPIDEPPRTIHGTVINSVTHVPVPHALVVTPGNRFAMLTDGEGHFEFNVPKSATPDGVVGGVGGLSQGFTFGPNELIARKPGYLDDPTGTSHAEATADGELQIALLPEGIIKGRVLSSETDPSPNISLHLYWRQVQDGLPRWVPHNNASTNSNGEFRFAELQPGTYKLATGEQIDNDPATTIPGGQQYGFPPVYFPGVSDFAAAATIQLAAGQTVEADIPLARQPYYPVKIPVANADPDTPGHGLNVTVSVPGQRMSEYSLGYNAEKQEIEGMLPNGKYIVEAMSFRPNSSISGSSNLSVSGSPAEGSALTLVPSGTINVHVTEQFSETEPGSPVTLSNRGQTFEVKGPRTYLNVIAEPADDFQRPGGGLRQPAGANDDSLVLQNLMPGRYWLRVQSNRGYVAAANMGGVDLLHQPFTVSPGSSTPIEITVRDDSAELEGTIAGMDPPKAGSSGIFHFGGPPQEQAYVYCIPLPDSSGYFQMVWASPDGKFTAANMAPGNYRILAFKTQHPNLPYRDTEAMKAYDSKGQVMHLSPAQKANVQLQLIASD